MKYLHLDLEISDTIKHTTPCEIFYNALLSNIQIFVFLASKNKISQTFSNHIKLEIAEKIMSIIVIFALSKADDVV